MLHKKKKKKEQLQMFHSIVRIRKHRNKQQKVNPFYICSTSTREKKKKIKKKISPLSRVR